MSQQRKGLRLHVSSQGPGLVLLLLVLHATECRVDVRIVRLKPVPEGSPQHASGSARRPSLHHVVFAVEEIRGIAGVEGHGHKPRERREFRSRPFPPVAHQIVNSKRARSVRMRACWRRIPLLEIKVPTSRARRVVAPRISSLTPALARSISRSVKLFFAWQRAPQPLRVGRSLRMAYVNGPVQRQADLTEHRTVHPKISILLPKRRMLNAFLFLPG